LRKNLDKVVYQIKKYEKEVLQLNQEQGRKGINNDILKVEIKKKQVRLAENWCELGQIADSEINRMKEEICS
jgi:hypothetical protein